MLELAQKNSWLWSITNYHALLKSQKLPCRTIKIIKH
jgi:hypothetical protein